MTNDKTRINSYRRVVPMIYAYQTPGYAKHEGWTKIGETKNGVERRIRQQKNGEDYLYFYTEKHTMEDGARWVTEKPISEKAYIRYLMEGDSSLHSVRKTKYRFHYAGRAMEIDVYPFSGERAVLFVYGSGHENAVLPEEIRVLRDVTGDLDYKNRRLAATQVL